MTCKLCKNSTSNYCNNCMPKIMQSRSGNEIVIGKTTLIFDWESTKENKMGFIEICAEKDRGITININENLFGTKEARKDVCNWLIEEIEFFRDNWEKRKPRSPLNKH